MQQYFHLFLTTKVIKLNTENLEDVTKYREESRNEKPLPEIPSSHVPSVPRVPPSVTVTGVNRTHHTRLKAALVVLFTLSVSPCQMAPCGNWRDRYLWGFLSSMVTLSLDDHDCPTG